MNLKPLGDRIVVKPIEENPVGNFGLIIPDTAKAKPQEGTVLAAGKGKINVHGDIEPLEVKEGDTVLYSKYGGTELRVDDEEVIILRESDILAVV